MTPTWKVHQRFQIYWGQDYKHSHIDKVCWAIIGQLNKKVKGHGLLWVRKNWATVCNFLIKWEGSKKGIGY